MNGNSIRGEYDGQQLRPKRYEPTGAEPTPVREITGTLTQVQERLTGLEEEAGRLADDLEIVLAPSRPTTSDKAERQGAQSSLGDALIVVAQRLESLRTQLRELRDRIQL